MMNRLLQTTLNAVAGCWLAVATQAAEIKGHVIEPGTATVKIAVDGEWLPVAGDPLEIYFELAGFGETLRIATGKVTEVGDTIIGKIEQTFSPIERVHLAKITSANPRKRGLPSSGDMPPSTLNLPKPALPTIDLTKPMGPGELLQSSPSQNQGGGSGTPNSLRADEQAAGWRLLFQGSSLDGWQVCPGTPADAWKVEDGCIVTTGPSGVARARNEWGYLGTTEEFGDFELEFQWKVSAKANSGVFYRGAADQITASPEYQVFDNTGQPEGNSPENSAGAIWGVMGPSANVVRPLGQFNDARIICRGTHLEHWLNGVKVVDCDTTSTAWATASRQVATWYPGYGKSVRGRIHLQNVVPTAWFRNLKIRSLAPQAATESGPGLARSSADIPSVAEYLPAAQRGDAFARALVQAIHGCRQDWIEWYQWEWSKGRRKGGDTLMEFAGGFRRQKELADQGSAFHAYVVCRLLEQGIGADRDYALAANYCRQAAAQGLARAQGHLGWCHQFGNNGVAKDASEALRWLKSGAEGGDAGAQWDLALAFANGWGTPKDEAEAKRWFTKAAKAGFAPGQSSLGWCYERGVGGETNQREALEWYRKAAEQQHSGAENIIGVFYENGQGGLNRDVNEAIRWYRKAVSHGNQKAKENLKRLGINVENGQGGARSNP